MCQLPYSRAWCVGERSGTLQRLIGNFKFQNAKSGYKALSELLLDRIPQLPPETVIVPIPTVSSHIRQRGYDHTLLIAKHFARRRKHSVSSVIQRATSTKQRQASKAQRIAQAKAAFKIAGSVNPDVPYLLIDDVMTTGATIRQYSLRHSF
jgi:ComF family protein